MMALKKTSHRLGFKHHKAMRLRLPFKSSNSASADQQGDSNEWSVEHQADYALKAKFKDDSDNEDNAHVDESNLGLGSFAGALADEVSDPTFTAKFKSGGFGDMFWQLLSVGKDLTMEKINILKDILAMLDQIKNARGKDAEEPVSISVVDADPQDQANLNAFAKRDGEFADVEDLNNLIKLDKLKGIFKREKVVKAVKVVRVVGKVSLVKESTITMMMTTIMIPITIIMMIPIMMMIVKTMNTMAEIMIIEERNLTIVVNLIEVTRKAVPTRTKDRILEMTETLTILKIGNVLKMI